MHPLVDAYIKGRPKFKKLIGNYFDDEKKPKQACHLGAMYYGFYKKADLNPITMPLFVKDFPEIHKIIPVPCDHDDVGYISAILIHLNDEHNWSDAKITEWLQGELT